MAEQRSAFVQTVEALKEFVAALDKPLEHWTEFERAELRRRAGGDSLALAFALAAPLDLEVSSEHPHRAVSDGNR